MKTEDLHKVLGIVTDTLGDALDDLAGRFKDGAEKLGDEYAHLSEFAAGWSKLGKPARRLFIDQLMKSSALVLAAGAATKLGIKLAQKRQRQLRKVLLGVADLIAPVAKTKKKGKKAVRKARKKLKKMAA